MLPRDETAFFGREAEIHAIEQLVGGGARLVTVVGFGGIGKTRLALAVAEKLGDAYFVPLAEARTLEAAVRAVAGVLRVAITSTSRTPAALGTLAHAIEERGRLLLVLDNLEQLGDAARALVDGLLDEARSLVVLATSRSTLGARGEEKLVLAPLEEREAIALLRDRARAATGGVASIEEAEALAIVRRVDRLPLAIELAASRLEVLSPSDLLSRLGRLDVLASSQRQTMRATLEWSWELLSEVERSALVQASVFAAPFDVDAAEEIVVVEDSEVLDVLERLVHRSLLVRVMGKRVRLAMFETVRTWAREKLAPPVVMRHAVHHLAEAERAAAHAYGEGGVSALDRLEALLPELLEAFDATKEATPDVAARIVLALSDLLLFRGLVELRTELFAAGAAAAERAGDDGLRARTLVAKARVTLEEGRMQDAEVELRRALVLATNAGDDVTRAEATRSLGWTLGALGRGIEAEAALNEADALHRAHGHARGMADVRVAFGILRAFEGRPSDALAYLREALAIHVDQGDVIRQEKVLGFGALVGQDAREIARGLPREVVARARGETGRGWQEAIDHHRRGVLAYERNDMDAAIVSFDRAVSALQRAGVKRGVSSIHAHAAAALAASGDGAEAASRIALARTLASGDAAAERVVDVFAAAIDVIGGAAIEAAKTLLAEASRTEIATPDLGIAARVLALALESTRAPVTGNALVVGREARWIVPPGGERVDLVRYGPVRRLLDRLVVARLEEPGTALSAEALIEAGWPGERMRHSAGLLRVYSAVRRLRRLGLEQLIVTRDDGYLLDPDAAIRRESM